MNALVLFHTHLVACHEGVVAFLGAFCVFLDDVFLRDSGDGDIHALKAVGEQTEWRKMTFLEMNQTKHKPSPQENIEQCTQSMKLFTQKYTNYAGSLIITNSKM